MKRKVSLARYFRSTIIRWTVFSMGMILFISVPTLYHVLKTETEKKAQGLALALATAYRPMILNGNIRFAEERIKESLHLSDGESISIVDFNGVAFSKVPEGLQEISNEILNVPESGSYWHSLFKLLSVRQPIYYDEERSSLFGYLQLTMKPVFDDSLVLFFVILIGGICLVQMLGLVKSLIPAANNVAAKLQRWSAEIRTLPEQAIASSGIPFSDLEPMQEAVVGLHSQVQKLREQVRTSAHVALLKKVKHELRTPIGQLKRFHHALFSEIKDGQIPNQELLNQCERAVQRTHYLVDQLSSLEQEVITARPVKCDLKSELEKLVRDLAGDEEIRDRNLRIDCNFEDNVPAVVIDRDNVQTIASNLVRNAVHASPSGGRITIRLSYKDEQPLLIVADQGDGITPEIQDKIFEFGFSTKGTKGTGLGLGIVKELCDAAQIKIDFEGLEGGGTLFRLAFPIAEIVNHRSIELCNTVS